MNNSIVIIYKEVGKDPIFRKVENSIKNTISALKSVLSDNNLSVININGLEIPTVLSIDELEEYYNSI